MIRTFRLALLLACAGSALAQPLYKWTEADGSITFSPEKPQSGIDFQVIDATPGVSSSKIAVRDSATSQSGTNASYQSTNTEQISYSTPKRVVPVASSYKSVIRLNSSSLPISSADSNAGQKAAMSSIVNQHSGQTIQSSSAAVQKQNQCENLRKRVVSLERRLKSQLTPTDMDNTIVHMSRYQRSYDQYCVQ